MKAKRKRINKREKEEEEFPGYPKYPANEDIMKRGDRVLLDSESPQQGSEGLDLQNGLPPENINETPNPPRQPDPLDPEKDNKTDELKDRVYPVDFAGKDLDVPGAELDDEAEETGSEDEENNLYSRGDD